jgi:hypothetical protein
MRYRILFAILISLAAPLAFSAKESPSMNAQSETLTLDRAIGAIRSKSPRPGSTFQFLRELQSSTETRELAQRSMQEASSHHVALYNDGVFLDLLRNGGLLILEVDSATDRAVWIHLVSSGANGRMVIDSHEVQGNLKSNVATDLISKNADFVDVLLAGLREPVTTLEDKFSGGHFPKYEEPSERGFFEVPLGLTKLKASEADVQELAVLSGDLNLWPIRYAMSLSIYPASPSNALSVARHKRQTLLREFLRKNGKSSDFIYDLEDLESIRSVEQLRERISWLKRINDSLEESLKTENRSPNPDVNRSISTIGLQLGAIATGPGKENSFLVVTAPGLVVAWMRPGDGPWCVTKISLAEDSDHEKTEAEAGF